MMTHAQTSRAPLPARYLVDLRQHDLLSVEAEHELALAFADRGDPRAFEQLVTAHLRLVVKIAKEYARRPADLMDLVQEGNLGLMEGVRRFDPRRGVKLTSYAGYWIRAFILRYLMDNARVVRRVRTREDRRRFFQGELPPAEASLDQPSHPDGPPLGDALPDSASLPPDVALEEKESRQLLDRRLSEVRGTLDAREAVVLSERLLAETPPPLHAVGERLALTGERVRQIEKELLGRLRVLLGARPARTAARRARAPRRAPTAACAQT